jgi:tetratricopeptide (TPR) repeat protein
MISAMPPSDASSTIEVELSRVRELSKRGRHYEALVAAKTLAATTPANSDVLYLIAANQRCVNQIAEALATLECLEQQRPRFSLLHQERGHCLLTLRNVSSAIEAFRHAVTINPALSTSWIMLERLYRMTGDPGSAAAAAEHVSRLNNLPPAIVAAGSLFSDGDLPAAETILRAYLLEVTNVEALRLLARIEHRRGLLEQAELRFEAALKLAPNYRAARQDYVRVLIDRQKFPQAHNESEYLLTLEPTDRDSVSLLAAACVGLGEHERAIALYRQLIVASPESAELLISLGHSLRAVGRHDEASESYRAAATKRPSFGDAYWSLANLKIYRFSEDEIARMRTEEAGPATRPVDRYHLCFALGKAFEDRGEFADSWQFYERGNALKRAAIQYDPDTVEHDTAKQIEVCTAEFFAARKGVGVTNPDPILILGLPRSGSTLVEQILASHSQVDGTRELANLERIVLELQTRKSDRGDCTYPSVLTELAPEDFRELGERYMTETRAYRKTQPFFVDKMPNNFRHVGLIHLMMPNATIIDARREPMACCFSNLKQLFASGQEFTYSIEDVARYYRSYLELMRHWDAVLPGRVLRVWHEDVVEDLEGNVRRILDFCGLEFESACVEFFRTERYVSSASSAQVRRPIFRDSLFQWRHYEAWLGPLKDTLNDALIRYRE